MMEPPHSLLARGKVRHIGDPVAMVIADSVDAARNAAERINVNYRILPRLRRPLRRCSLARRRSMRMSRTISAAIGRSAIQPRPTPPLPGPIISPRSISSTIDWCPTQWNLGLLWLSMSPRPAITRFIPRPSFPMSRGC